MSLNSENLQGFGGGGEAEGGGDALKAAGAPVGEGETASSTVSTSEIVDGVAEVDGFGRENR